jgi:hypothetical protein
VHTPLDERRSQAPERGARKLAQFGADPATVGGVAVRAHHQSAYGNREGCVSCASNAAATPARDPHAVGIGVAIFRALEIAAAHPQRFRSEWWSLPGITILQHIEFQQTAVFGLSIHELVSVETDHDVVGLFPATRLANVRQLRALITYSRTGLPIDLNGDQQRHVEGARYPLEVPRDQGVSSTEELFPLLSCRSWS